MALEEEREPTWGGAGGGIERARMRSWNRNTSSRSSKSKGSRSMGSRSI